MRAEGQDSKQPQRKKAKGASIAGSCLKASTPEPSEISIAACHGEEAGGSSIRRAAMWTFSLTIRDRDLG
jgi:hypothetical protein